MTCAALVLQGVHTSIQGPAFCVRFCVRPIVYIHLMSYINFCFTARTSDITQLAAITHPSLQFSTYIMPRKAIEAGASLATGISVQGGQMFRGGKEVDTSSILEGLQSFITFLSGLNKPILIGHNIRSFDVPILYHHLSEHGLLSEFSEVITGFIDTLIVAKKKIKKKDILSQSYKQVDLAKDFLNKTYDSHNAVADVETLQELYDFKLKLDGSEKRSYVFPLAFSALSQSLQPLVTAKVISSQMKIKLAQTSIGFHQLKLAYQRDNDQGIALVFKQPCGIAMCPRVTKSSNVISKVTKYVSEIIEK